MVDEPRTVIAANGRIEIHIQQSGPHFRELSDDGIDGGAHWARH